MNRYALPALVGAAVILGIFVMYDWRTAVAIIGLLIVFGIAAAVSRIWS
jgi:hypothetical protein